MRALNLTRSYWRPKVLRSIASLRRAGFEGFQPISDLQSSRCCDLPDNPGIYMILRRNKKPPRFLMKSVGGHFKGKEPSVPLGVLKKNGWSIQLFSTLGRRAQGKRRFRNRVRAYMRFGEGEPVAHWGGRFIWQLGGWKDLTVCWKIKVSGSPREAEKKLILAFKALHEGKLPFANLKC
jgi:hypothetical protein